MQNDQMTIRGYAPQQNTGRMNTLPYQVPPLEQPPSRWKLLWQQLDPSAVALLGAALLCLGYALFATISFWWLGAVLPHLVLVWVTLLIIGLALFTRQKDTMLIAALGSIAAMLLFLNYCYLLIPQAILCLIAWRKA